jgi:hypothetical protein
MAKIVAVHGIGQQFKGDAIIHREWWPAYLSGLHLARRDQPDEREFVCPFYGHCFRRAGTLSAGDHFQVEDLNEEEAAWLDLLWDAAVQAETRRSSFQGRLCGRSNTRANTPAGAEGPECGIPLKVLGKPLPGHAHRRPQASRELS